jgi:hypothetical protein
VRLGTLLAVVVIAACGTVGQHAGGSQLAAADVAHDPAVADVYPGSMTPDGKQPGAAAEAAADEAVPPTNPPGFSGRPGYGQPAQAWRLLAAPATRQQIMSWYFQRLLHLGWRYQHYGYGLGENGGQDSLEMHRHQATIRVATYSQVESATAYPPFGTDQSDELFRLLTGGTRLTAYSVWLTACGRCVLSQSNDLPAPPKAINLGPSCPPHHPPVTFTLSGGASGSAAYACGKVGPAQHTNLDCNEVSHSWTIGPMYLMLVIGGRDVFWTPGTLRIAGPYTSDDQDWKVDSGPNGRQPTIVGAMATVHERLQFAWPIGRPPAVVDIVAPCTSFML